MAKAVSYLALYILAALFPLLLIAWLSGYSYYPFLAEVGKAFALMAFMLIGLQVVLAARFKGLDRVFGFDRIIRFHRYAA